MTTSVTKKRKQQLNVVFHGLWAWEAQQDKIRAHTPVEKDHEIVAGNYEKQTKLRRGGKFRVTGVAKGTDNTFKKLQNVSVQNKPFSDKKKQHCYVDLPLPRFIKSLRRVDVHSEHPFSGEDGEKLHPKQVSMVQALVYDCKDLKKVAVSPLKLKVKENPDGVTGNLHFFAQPPGGHHHSHNFVKAYENMALMFALKITPVEALFVKATENPGIKGMTKDDLLLLGEMADMPMHAAAGSGGGPFAAGSAMIRLMAESGSNCDGLVVDNRRLKTAAQKSALAARKKASPAKKK